MDGDLKHNTSSAKHDGGSALALARIAVSHTGLLVFIYDVAADRSRRMHSALPRSTFSSD